MASETFPTWGSDEHFSRRSQRDSSDRGLGAPYCFCAANRDQSIPQLNEICVLTGCAGLIDTGRGHKAWLSLLSNK